MLCEKDRKRDSDTEWRIYYLEWHLAVFLTTVTDPSLSLQDDAFRSPSLWRFPFPITSDALSFNRHSERRQKCCSRKTGNGIVTRSEESITRITSYRPLSFSTFSWQLTANGSQLTADSFYLLTAFLTTVTDPSLSLGMTPYHLPHYGSRSFTFVSDDALTSYTRIMEPAVRRNCWHTQCDWWYPLVVMI